MRTILIFLGALMLAAGPSAAQQTDEFAWLEEIEGTKALDWARARNTEALAFFQADSRYETLKTEAEDILQSTDRIPYFTRRGVWLYNFWQDKDHVRGIWRRTTLEEYRKPSPNWETMLDVDALGAVENKSWVYKSAICLPPAYLRCMIKLSDGGKDASVWREFDVMKKAFLPEGFTVPEAKSDLAWLDENALLLGTDFGPGSLTDSGYPFDDARIAGIGEAAGANRWRKRRRCSKVRKKTSAPGRGCPTVRRARRLWWERAPRFSPPKSGF